MDKNRNNRPAGNFDGEFDMGVFGGDAENGIVFADDDFRDYFDEDIVADEIERHLHGNDMPKTSSSEKEPQPQTAQREGKWIEIDIDQTKKLDSVEDIPTKKEKNKKEKAKKNTGETEDMAKSEKQLKKEQKAKEKQAKKDAKAEKRAAKTNKKQGKRSLLSNPFIYILFVLCCSFAVAGIVWLASTDILGFKSENDEVVVTIPKDFTISEVADILHENGVISYKPLFKVFAMISNADEKIYGGTYLLNTNYDYRAIVSGLTRSGSKLVEVDVVIPEGYTCAQIFDLLESQSICFASDLWDAAANYDFNYDFLEGREKGDEKRLEGYLFPDTYKFYMNSTPERALRKMLDNFDNKITDDYKKKVEDSGYTLNEILTVASLIEKEAAGEKDRADIASVIFNRLENKSAGTMGYLQLDSTIHYVIRGTDQEFSTEIDSPYNTYKYPGLPAGAIANPGMAAIKAALDPSDTNYFYFALAKDGEHRFFTNYDSFINFTNSSDYGG